MSMMKRMFENEDGSVRTVGDMFDNARRDNMMAFQQQQPQYSPPNIQMPNYTGMADAGRSANNFFAQATGAYGNNGEGTQQQWSYDQEMIATDPKYVSDAIKRTKRIIKNRERGEQDISAQLAYLEQLMSAKEMHKQGAIKRRNKGGK